MRFPSSSWSVVVGAGALAAISYIGFIVSRPVNTRIEWVTFFVSLAGLLGGVVVLAGTLIRGVIRRFGCTDTAAAAMFRNFIGVGLSASVMALLGFAAMNVALITFHPGPASDFVYSDRQRDWSVVGGAAFSVFFWPAQRLVMLSGRATPGWLSWLLCSLIYGVVLYVSITLIRRFFACLHEKPMA